MRVLIPLEIKINFSTLDLCETRGAGVALLGKKCRFSYNIKPRVKLTYGNWLLLQMGERKKGVIGKSPGFQMILIRQVTYANISRVNSAGRSRGERGGKKLSDLGSQLYLRALPQWHFWIRVWESKNQYCWINFKLALIKGLLALIKGLWPQSWTTESQHTDNQVQQMLLLALQNKSKWWKFSKV